MEIVILVKLGLISAITILLFMREENNKVEYFTQQTWSIKEVLRVYWVFILIFLVWLILYKNIPDKRLYIFVSYILTFFASSILFFATRIILGRRRLAFLKAIGAKASDLYWLAILIAIQYNISLIILYSGSSVLDHGPIFWMLAYFPITLLFWPVIESVFYLGMMFIPTSRIVGSIRSAVLVSLLQALSHFNYNLSEVAINFAIFGLLGCYLYFKSKRIIVPILAHSSINFLVLMRYIMSAAQ